VFRLTVTPSMLAVADDVIWWPNSAVNGRAEHVRSARVIHAALARDFRVVSPSAAFKANPVSATELLLHVSKESRCRKRANERLFGHHRCRTRRSGGDASDRRRLACDLRRVLTLHHRAHAGGCGEP